MGKGEVPETRYMAGEDGSSSMAGMAGAVGGREEAPKIPELETTWSQLRWRAYVCVRRHVKVAEEV